MISIEDFMNQAIDKDESTASVAFQCPLHRIDKMAFRVLLSVSELNPGIMASEVIMMLTRAAWWVQVFAWFMPKDEEE